MRDPSFFERHGFFIRRGFLSPGDCAEIVGAMAAGEATPARVYDGGESQIHRERRRVSRVAIPAAVQELVEPRISGLFDELGRHFGKTVSTMEALQFLHYRTGDFYEPHKDITLHEDLATRKLSVIVVLANDAVSEVGEGGALVFYGLMGEGAFAALGFPMREEVGLFVAFESTVAHAVTPIIEGERLSLVTFLS